MAAGTGGRWSRYPSRGVHLAIVADPVFGHLMVYADPAKPFFCVEPQSNASGAFNRAGGFDDPAEGVRVLAPGESLAGRCGSRPGRRRSMALRIFRTLPTLLA